MLNLRRLEFVVALQGAEQIQSSGAYRPIAIFGTNEDFVTNAKIHRRVSAEVVWVISGIFYPMKTSWLEQNHKKSDKTLG